MTDPACSAEFRNAAQLRRYDQKTRDTVKTNDYGLSPAQIAGAANLEANGSP